MAKEKKRINKQIQPYYLRSVALVEHIQSKRTPLRASIHLGTEGTVPRIQSLSGGKSGLRVDPVLNPLRSSVPGGSLFRQFLSTSEKSIMFSNVSIISDLKPTKTFQNYKRFVNSLKTMHLYVTLC